MVARNDGTTSTGPISSEEKGEKGKKVNSQIKCVHTYISIKKLFQE